MSHVANDQISLQGAGIPRRPRAGRVMGAALVAAALGLVLAQAAIAQTLKATITADNAYIFGYGTVAGVTNLSPDVENTTSAQIFTCGSGPEVYPGVPYVPNGYLYLVAYSDKAVTQGILAQFVSGASTAYTGTSAWEVYATGVNYNPGSGGPPLAVINTQIGIANAGTGGGGSSHGWVGLAGGPIGAGYVGALANGQANVSSGPDFPQACPSSLNPTAPNRIDDAARWMWYNPSGLADPFRAPVAGEFLIFRLPFSQVATPRDVVVNKDISNPTGQTATGVSILIAGHHSLYRDIYHATTPTFTVVPTGANDLLEWSGGNIAPGAVVHVGFALPETSIDILGLYMTSGGVIIGCAHQCNSDLHLYGFGGNITYTNSASACESVPLYVGNVSLQYFPNEVPLALMNPTAVLSPIRTDTIEAPPTLVAPDSSASVGIFPPPAGGNWVLLRYTVSTSPTLAGPGNTEDFVQFPVPATSAAAATCTPSSTALCLNNRFKVTAHFDAGGGNSGTANVVQLTPDTGYLWFFSGTNVEAVVKVLNGCGLNSHYWVFAGGLTNVNVVLTVTDTMTSVVRTYTNPANTKFQPIQDTGAFATCP